MNSAQTFASSIAPEDSAFHGSVNRDALVATRNLRAAPRDLMTHRLRARDARQAWPRARAMDAVLSKRPIKRAPNERRREVIEREQDLKAQQATLQALESAIAQSDSRITQLRSQFRSQLLGERVEAQAAVSRLAQEVAKAGFRSGLLEVRAPVAGTVQGLSTTTLGAVVQAGAQLLTVVPQGDVLRAEAVLANDDIGFVQVGQSAKVKLAAYQFQKYGLLEGRVVNLSADAVEPNEAAKATGSAYAAPQLAYKAVIELAAQNLTLPNGARLRLTPGMAATIEIHQGRRTVMEYLLSPVQRVGAEAARER